MDTNENQIVIKFRGTDYTASRRTNYSKAVRDRYMNMVATLYMALSAELGLDAEQVAEHLVDLADASSRVSGGEKVLLHHTDTPEQTMQKCRDWMLLPELSELSDLLKAAITELNKPKPFIPLPFEDEKPTSKRRKKIEA